jgi:hypothetical protein
VPALQRDCDSQAEKLCTNDKAAGSSVHEEEEEERRAAASDLLAVSANECMRAQHLKQMLLASFLQLKKLAPLPRLLHMLCTLPVLSMKVVSSTTYTFFFLDHCTCNNTLSVYIPYSVGSGLFLPAPRSRLQRPNPLCSGRSSSLFPEIASFDCVCVHLCPGCCVCSVACAASESAHASGASTGRQVSITGENEDE